MGWDSSALPVPGGPWIRVRGGEGGDRAKAIASSCDWSSPLLNGVMMGSTLGGAAGASRGGDDDGSNIIRMTGPATA